MNDKENKLKPQDPIAVVGIGGLFPGAKNVREYWQNILTKKDLMTEVPRTYFLPEDLYDPDPKAPEKTYCKKGAFLPTVPFDPVEFGIAPNTLPSTDCTQLLSLLVAKSVLDDGNLLGCKGISKDRVSVILGYSMATALLFELTGSQHKAIWERALRENGLDEEKIKEISRKRAECSPTWTEDALPGLLQNVIAGRISNRFDLHGTNCVIDAACASSISALHLAIKELVLGDADLVITGGVQTLAPLTFICFSKTPALSPRSVSRPFDSSGDGMMMGEGIGMIALRRLEDAERDKNKIYAVIRGIGTSSDGRARSIYAPEPKGQILALRRAYEKAGYGPDTVELVEAHGTGTKAGDSAELKALSDLFNETGREDRQWCAVGSIKSQIGHTLGAAGAAGLMKAILALHHKVLPPTINVTTPTNAIDFSESPFYVNTEARPWIHPQDYPRRASVSSFGFGGTNFHVTLEEYTGLGDKPNRLDKDPVELFLFSADEAGLLIERCQRLDRSRKEDGYFSKLAIRSQEDFNPAHRYRLSIVADSPKDLEEKLQKAIEAVSSRPEKIFSLPTGVYFMPRFQRKKIAFLFPGQGSQSLNMGADLARRFDSVRKTWDRLDRIRFDDEFRLSDVVYPRPSFTKDEERGNEERLKETRWAQPALGATSAAMISLLGELGIRAELAAGHSFGEIIALYYAGVFDFEKFLNIARKRGQLMATASEVKGGMVSVVGNTDRILEIITEMESSVIVANYNSPTQAVISGEFFEVKRIQERLEKEGMKTRPLNVSSAFHSSLVAGAVDEFRHYLNGLNLDKPNVTVYSNTTASPMPSDTIRLSQMMAEHLASPVRFCEEIQQMFEEEANVFIEVGPGFVLTRLVEEILGKDHSKYVAINLDSKGQNGLTGLYHAVGRLAVAGVPVNLAALRMGEAQEELPDEAIKKHVVHINGTTYMKKYPPIETVESRANTVESLKVESRKSEEIPIKKAVGTDWVPDESAKVEKLESWKVESDRKVVSEREEVAGDRLSDVSKKPLTDNRQLATEPRDQSETAKLLLEIVAEKTGYPIDILKLDMHLEADLGIDSIKRVEILSAVRDRLPGAPEIGSEQLAELETLQQIVGFLNQNSVVGLSSLVGGFKEEKVQPSFTKNQQPTTSDRPRPPQRTIDQEPKTRDQERITNDQSKTSDILLSVVAEKTGYPIDILKLDMHLEADLGIDSIKRVEILSAVRDRLPGAPEIGSEQLAELETLGQIVEFLEKGARSSRLIATDHPAKIGDSRLSALSGPVAVSRQPSAVSAPLPTPNSQLSTLPQEQFSPSPSPIKRYEIRSVPIHDDSKWPLAPGREVVLVSDRRGIAEEMVPRLQRQGFKVRICQDDSELAPPVPIGAVIFLGGLRPLADFHDGVRLNKEAFRVAKAVAAHLNDAAAKGGGWFVTVQDLGGDFGFSTCDFLTSLRGGLAGLTKTLAQEWPAVRHKAIDIDTEGRPPEEVADAIVNEILRGGTTTEVGLSAAGERSRLELVEVSRSASQMRIQSNQPRRGVEGATRAPMIDENSVIVATGGARGVTAAALIELAKQARPKMVLLGRSPILEEEEWSSGIKGEGDLKKAIADQAQKEGVKVTPAELEAQTRTILHSREVSATLSALRQAGSQVRYYAVDIQESRLIRTEGSDWHLKAGSLVRTVLDEVRREWGSITGLIHGAGVIADKLITEKTQKQFDIVFDTKVRGFSEMLTALEKDPLKVISVFSSTAARFGNKGQSDYAMANEVLNKMAQAERLKRGGNCLVKSINWGPWEGGMVDASLRHEFEQKGVSLIPLDLGAQMFVNELQGLAPHRVEIVIGSF